jgi:hypothetical protein
MTTQASMYTLSVPVFARMLNNLAAILDKAATHAEAKKIDPAVLLDSRLFPDMFPLRRQVLLACEFAKGGIARLAGEEPPKWDDAEVTLADLHARIARTIEFVNGFAPARVDGSEGRAITLQVRGETVKTEGYPYLAQRVLPNFFFHLTTAYDILRKDGVELGKRDFIGPL